MRSTGLAYADVRREERAEVHLRTSLTADGREWPAVIVNLSPNGLMARCDGGCATGDAVHIRLPGLPPVAARVMWALGGRIGCEFAATLSPAHYFSLLAGAR